ncbi:MAG: pre-peptidase C-terminal domain-containing protein [Fimbriimonadaceae bacterium]|uniref:Peptidase C-terminal archaeal/bacterial domain-containing protein n=1 Tax=Candidatus Nitrosymbiomonas proteolyticus TaxID=2608984 RepID=A0A809S7W9_9BACT|nr:pre-peptidase C-terminal domain-containing protein [Fimbriimonadaceae bacterium]NUM39026.1 pre-peptidase C-terminal domain-containing protein [Armatimonadota bacterium]BBO22551.1 conserved hypothetical protein [Candidatus Nitrosymbiomonas proteolyticus]
MLSLLLAGTMFAVDVLPDMGVWGDYLGEAYIGTTSSSEPPAGRRAIRISTATVNYGPGRLELRGGEIVGSQQRVYQRVFRDDGGWYDREAGWFVYHASHGHIHFNDWTVFHLRELLPDGTPGEIVRTGDKTSFCILELLTYNSSLPGYGTPPSYSSCGQIQGLRPGRADIYSSGLTDQYIDIVGMPDGDYWLEAEVDPDNLVLEADETNNVAGIPFTIGPVPATVDDAYENNDSRAQVDALPEGAPNSANLGLVLTPKVIHDLSMNDDDWFKLRLHASEEGDYIRIASGYLRTGNLNLQLLNAAGSVIQTSTNSHNVETINLRGLPAGTYYVRVYNSTSTSNPNYRLEVVPGANAPPTVVVTEPSVTMYVEYAEETFPVHWNGSDPDGDPKWVSLFLTPSKDDPSGAIEIPGYQNLYGYMGQVNVNTVTLPIGKWYVMVQATDGGAYSESWAPASVTLFIHGDLNLDGALTMADFDLLRPWVEDAEVVILPPGWHRIADMNHDDVVDHQDLEMLRALIG